MDVILNNLLEEDNGVYYVDKWVIDCKTSVTDIILRSDTAGIADYAFYGCGNLTSITFMGTKEQWNAIVKGYEWNYEIDTIHCTDGDLELNGN